jgi:urease accessory protein
MENPMLRLSPLSRALILALPVAALAGQAMAHPGHGLHSGFASGFLHPILGWDHVVAMLAVGLWAAFLGGRALFVLPLVFPLVMALGGALGMMGVALPAVEAGIAASGVVLGLLVAFAVRAPLAASAALVGVFAVFHGHAHGTEMPEAYGVFGYGVGFLIGTVLLHLAGIALGLAARSEFGRIAMRGAGGVIALTGAAFLFGMA